MLEVRRRRRDVALIGLRARAPHFLRALAIVLGAGVVYFIGYSFYHPRRSNEFKLRSGKAELSTNVTRRVENYERRVEDGGRLTMLVRAAVATSFDDGHHELTQVHIEQYPEGASQANRIDAREAVYFSETEQIAFSGAVQIETADRLKVNSEAIHYDMKSERGESQVPLAFSRDNVAGHADAATVEGKQKHLELRGNVEITVSPAAGGAGASGASGGVSGAAGVRAKVGDQPVTIHAPRADFDQVKMQLAFTGGATAEQGRDVMNGDSLAGFINEQKKVKRIEARGNSYLRSGAQGHAAEVHSVNMDFFFDAGQKLERAFATQQVVARTLDSESEATLSTPTAVEVFFNSQGDESVLKEMHAGGRPVVTLAAPRSQADNPKAASKRLTANTLKLIWRATGRDLEKAEAVGEAELVIEPVQQTATADRKVLVAPRFDCDFLEQGNLAREFRATGGTKTTITPVVANEKRGVRTLTADNVTAIFAREAQDVERVEAQGNTLFNEGDRNGQSDNATYTTADSTVRLRGGEPVAWDSRARIKATEIDTNGAAKVTYARSHVQTTYYSQEQTGGATPFSKVKSPVFVTSDAAEFRHDEGLGVYTGNARAWQDDNFVRADKITIRRESRRMEGEGRVQSALYRARRKDASGNPTVVPVFAASNRMFYSDTDRQLHYEGAVDIKQGTERINSEVADVYLQKEQSEVDHMVAQRAVVVTQPGRKGTGDRGEYTAADETMVLTGNPARVEDAEQGTTEGQRMTVYLRENRVVSDSAAAEGERPTGRVHTVHKIKKP
jgi:LPS export ABC transporter protein LptC/lipopolysaccharide transport protein LptA